MSQTDRVSTDAGALFRAGRLDDAVAAAGAAVKAAPGDLGARVLLAELLVFAGALARADIILDAASLADPSAAMVVAEFRQLLRAEQARWQVFRDGRMPDFLDGPTPAMSAQLAAQVALRAGDIAEAAARATEAEVLRPRVAGVAEGPDGETGFSDLRDADDLCAGFIDVLTTTGKYMWIPTERVAEMVLHPPLRPRDLAWRRASLSVESGPDGDVYLPALYVPADGTLTDELRLGRETAWLDAPGAPVRGMGQRVFLVGDDAWSAMDLRELRIQQPASS